MYASKILLILIHLNFRGDISNDNHKEKFGWKENKITNLRNVVLYNVKNLTVKQSGYSMIMCYCYNLEAKLINSSFLNILQFQKSENKFFCIYRMMFNFSEIKRSARIKLINFMAFRVAELQGSNMLIVKR